MGKIVGLLSINPRLASRRQGLRKLTPDLISKARDETATQVTRVGLTFLGTAAFCLLSLLSPDSALLSGSERINVPFAGPVSFFGFILLGPLVLIVLRVYLQIYVEHSVRLDRLARSVSAVRAPTLVALDNSLLRLFGGFIFYMLLPWTMVFFAWKAAVFPAWGLGLFSVAAAVLASHVLMLCPSVPSWRLKGLLSVGVAIIAGGAMSSLDLPRRPFDLHRANLSGHWLARANLRKANLGSANLSSADLPAADLEIAYLGGANLTDAKLIGANLTDALLPSANLTNIDVTGAGLTNADLSGANLTDAKLIGANLTGANLSRAKLIGAILFDANLSRANLSRANLSRANLTDADLIGANLTDADLTGADLTDANLTDANLSSAKNLAQTQLDRGCGNADTKLPEGLTLRSCSR